VKSPSRRFLIGLLLSAVGVWFAFRGVRWGDVGRAVSHLSNPLALLLIPLAGLVEYMTSLQDWKDYNNPNTFHMLTLTNMHSDMDQTIMLSKNNWPNHLAFRKFQMIHQQKNTNKQKQNNKTIKQKQNNKTIKQILLIFLNQKNH
jgi:hypothetical protein